jgi:hypothetical protein
VTRRHPWDARILCLALVVTACGSSPPGPSGSPTPTPTPAKVVPVQCRDNAECPNNSLCFASLPGGMCVNCANNLGCPAGTTCGANAAIPATSVCIRSCAVDADCTAGLVCTLGACVPVPCGPGLPACRAPNVCGNQNLCARPRCSDGCPPATTCGVAGFCVEL